MNVMEWTGPGLFTDAVLAYVSCSARNMSSGIPADEA